VIGRAATSLRLRAADAADALLGRRDALTPPRRLDYVGDSDFRATGEEFLRHFRTLAGLRPDDRVLDIGCGIGRMARVLVPVLRPPGSYDGFDVVAAGVAWCCAHYRATPAPYRFQHADVHNARYNPSGRVPAQEHEFPYAAGTFDLAIATSVFTHMLAPAADHYLGQAARVLAPGGRLFCTWFLLSGEHEDTPPAPFRRVDATPAGAVADPALPEAAVAFDEAWLRERLGAHGLELRAIHPGSWRGSAGTSYQDLVLAVRA
jgi:SAM-dependent methyltransferase